MKRSIFFYSVVAGISVYTGGCDNPARFISNPPSAWSSIGPASIPVRKLVLDEPYLYVCAGAKGLWRKNLRSSEPWNYIGFADSTLTEHYSGVTDVDPKGSDIIVSYIGNDRDAGVGLWRSIDGSRSFFRSDSGIFDSSSCPHPYMNGVKRSLLDPSLGLAAAFGLYRTSDGGSSWKPSIDRGCDYNIFFEDIVWNPKRKDDAWFFGSTPGLGQPFLGHSTDAGVTWQGVYTEQLPISDYAGIRRVLFDAVDTNIVYLVVPPMTLKSSNNGGSWFFVQPLFSAIATHPSTHNRVYFADSKGIYSSADGGETMILLAPPLGVAWSSVLIDRVKGDIYFGTSNGVYKYVQ
jgi:hypothetical protein